MAEDKIGEMYIEIEGRLTKLEKDLQTAKVKSMAEGKKAGTGFAQQFSKGLSFLGITAGVAGLIGIFKKSIDAFNEQERVTAQLNQTLISTKGVAGLTKDELLKMAAGLQKVTRYGDEAIIPAESLLLTFTKIGKDVFPRVLESVLDVSTAMGQDLKSTVIQLGKALNDPILGLSALSRTGIQFSEQQKKQIKSFVAVNDVASAQKVILEELETQFGGSARAAGTTFAGKMEMLTNRIGDLSERIGKAMMPALEDMAKKLDAVTASGEEAEGVFIAIEKVFGLIANVINNAVNALKMLWTPIIGIVATFVAIVNGDFKKAAELTEQMLYDTGNRAKEWGEGVVKTFADVFKGSQQLKDQLQQPVFFDFKTGKIKPYVIPVRTGKVDDTSVQDFTSKIPKGYTAAQVVEFEELKFAVKGYVDYRKAVIEMMYQQEVKAAQEGTGSLLAAEENKKLELAKLEREIVNIRKEANEITNQVIEQSLAEREDEMQQEIDNESDMIIEGEERKRQAVESYYDRIMTLSDDYFEYRFQQIQNEVDEYLTATGNMVGAKQLEIDLMKQLEQEYFDWQVDKWREQANLFPAILDGMSSAYDTFWQTLSDADMTGTERLAAMWQSMKSTALQVIGDIIKEYITNFIKAQVVGDTFKAMELAKGTVLGTSLAKAYAPAAAFASTMSFGGAAVAGSAGLVSTVALANALAIPKLEKGGEFVVPPGYDHDKFPMLVSSGERVSVTSKPNTDKQDSMLQAVSRKLEVLNMNLIEKDLSVVVENHAPEVKTTVRRGELVKTTLERGGVQFNER